MILFGLAPDIANGYTNLQPLSCNSVNRIPESETTEYLFISPKTRDCIFLFEGAPHTNLDMKLRSLSNANQLSWDDQCSNSTLRMYNYIEGNRVELDQMVCSEASVITDTNMGVVTSSLNDGSFVLEVRSLTKRSPSISEIFGMLPPVDGARDFYSSENFIPSPGSQSGWSPFRAVPVSQPTKTTGATYFRPVVQAPYPGRPTSLVDLTYSPVGPTHAAVSSSVPSSTTSPSIIKPTQQVSSENPNITTSEAPTTMKGSTTYVEIHITNGTDFADSKEF